jgi:hypothetical protein
MASRWFAAKKSACAACATWFERTGRAMPTQKTGGADRFLQGHARRNRFDERAFLPQSISPMETPRSGRGHGRVVW